MAHEHLLGSVTNLLLAQAIVGKFTPDQRESLIKGQEDKINRMIDEVKKIIISGLSSVVSDTRSAELEVAFVEVASKWLTDYSAAMRDGRQLK